MRRRLSNYFYVGNQYKDEVRTQVRMFIIFTLAFTIAFTWRETIFDLSKSFVQRIMGVEGANSSSIWASVFITILSILLILLVSKYFKKENN